MVYNKELRALMAKTGITQRKVAEVLCITRYTLNRWLAEPMKPEKSARVRDAINNLTGKQ